MRQTLKTNVQKIIGSQLQRMINIKSNIHVRSINRGWHPTVAACRYIEAMNTQSYYDRSEERHWNNVATHAERHSF